MASADWRTRSNTQLEPLESDNIDLSLEYYFGDASYVSAGFFHKKVKNFIGQEVTTQGLFGITDQTSGPRAQAPRRAAARDASTDDTNLFVMMAMMENPGTFVDANGVTWTGGADELQRHRSAAPGVRHAATTCCRPRRIRNTCST